MKHAGKLMAAGGKTCNTDVGDSVAFAWRVLNEFWSRFKLHDKENGKTVILVTVRS